MSDRDESKSPSEVEASADDPAMEKRVDDTVVEAPPGMASIDPRNEITGIRLLVLHSALCLCFFLLGLDFNLIATAIPRITADFHTIEDIGWYGSAFFITLCATQPLIGKSFILFPKKFVYLSSLAIFEIGSLVCALAPSSKALVIGRVVAGFGASGIFAGGLVIITTIIPLERRAVWQAAFFATFAVASVIGPVIGGALTENVTWRWCFYINLPIGGFAAVIIFFLLNVHKAPTEKQPMVQKLKSLDGIGFSLFSGAVVMLLLALQWGGTTYDWNSSTIIGLFVGFGIVAAIFVFWQLRLQDGALIPPKLFSTRNMSLILLAAFCSNGPFQTIVYWLPVWFQVVLGASPTSSGVRYLPTVISDVLSSFIAGGAVNKIGIWNPFLLAGFALMSIGAGLLTTLYPGVPDGHWIGFQILCGIGYSLVISIAHLGVQASLPPDLVPLGATTVLFGQTFSCAVFLAVGQAVFQHRLIQDLTGVVPDAVLARIISIGATQIREHIGQQDLPVVLDAYSRAITNTFFIATAGPVLSFLLVCGAAWTRIPKPASQ